MFARDGAQARRDGVERFFPRNPLEAALALRAHALLRIEQAVGRIFALKILGHFTAQEAARDGMIGVAAQASGADAFLAILYMDQYGAGVGAIEGTDGMPRFHTRRIAIANELQFHGCGVRNS